MVLWDWQPEPLGEGVFICSEAFQGFFLAISCELKSERLPRDIIFVSGLNAVTDLGKLLGTVWNCSLEVCPLSSLPGRLEQTSLAVLRAGSRLSRLAANAAAELQHDCRGFRWQLWHSFLPLSLPAKRGICRWLSPAPAARRSLCLVGLKNLPRSGFCVSSAAGNGFQMFPPLRARLHLVSCCVSMGTA